MNTLKQMELNKVNPKQAEADMLNLLVTIVTFVVIYAVPAIILKSGF